MKKEPSPEVRAVISEFVRVQREKYGEDWKRILAVEMAEKSAPYLKLFLEKTNARP